jgi:hypothetical protein
VTTSGGGDPQTTHLRDHAAPVKVHPTERSVRVAMERDPDSNGRYWIRTSDPFRVKEVRYHCANRPNKEPNTPRLNP